MSSEYSWVDEPGSPAMTPDSVVLSCFPSAGLATTVAGHYIVRTLGLKRTARMESPDELPVAVIQQGQVQPAVRVYGRNDFSMVLSEFPPTDRQIQRIARAVLNGAEQRKARMVLCLEGVLPQPFEDDEEEPADESLWLAIARNDPNVKKWFEPSKARPLEEGVLGGVSGALLVAGIEREIPVAVLLVSARSNVGYPDHRAGATLIEALDRVLPDLKIDVAPLRVQAERIEKALRAAMAAQSKSAPAGNGPSGDPAPIYQ
ncbi:MAG: PAC2 family protein [Thermoplasmata archaeon]